MDKNEIWQKIERLLEKMENCDLVRVDRADFEQALKEASDYAYIEIENATQSDLLDRLRKELETLPMKSVKGCVLTIGAAPAEVRKLSANYVRCLLETIQAFTSGVKLIWGCGADPVNHADRYSVTVVFAMSGQ